MYICVHDMYVYMYICACIQDVCMYVYRSVYVYTSPGPKYGMECIKCRCSFVRCSLSLSLVSLHVSVFQWLLPATYRIVLVVCHSYFGEVCVQCVQINALPTYVCVLCSCKVVCILYTVFARSANAPICRLVYKYIHVHMHTDSAQQTHRHVES